MKYIMIILLLTLLAACSVTTPQPTSTPQNTPTTRPLPTTTSTSTPIPTATEIPTATAEPTVTPTPTQSPDMIFFSLFKSFAEGTSRVISTVFQKEISDAELATLENELAELTLLSQGLMTFNTPLEKLDQEHAYFLETVDVCMLANEGTIAINQVKNAGGQWLSIENISEIFISINECPEMIQSLTGRLDD